MPIIMPARTDSANARPVVSFVSVGGYEKDGNILIPRIREYRFYLVPDIVI